MKHLLYILVIMLFSRICTYGQSYEKIDQIIIKLKNNTVNDNKLLLKQNSVENIKIDSISKLFNSINITKHSLGKNSKQFIYVIKFPKGTNIQKVIDEYNKTGEIEYAEPDYKGSAGGNIIPNDLYYYRQWGLNNNATFEYTPAKAGSDIEMEKAWEIQQGDSNIIVAIIDSGLKLDHPEFAGRLWINKKEIPNNKIDDDGNGYIDDINGWNFILDANYLFDDLGHGTNVAGILGANGNNSIGYAGVDWHCKIMILKVLDDTGLGDYSWFSEALYYAVDNGAKVVNMSLGGTDVSTTLQNAVNYAINNGVVVVACMMNTNTNFINYPAGCQGVIAVGSTNSDDTRSNPFLGFPYSGSNFGSHISVVAPGNCIFGLSYKSNTDYNIYYCGTSQATPLVTGLASLLLAQDSSRTPAQIKSIIEMTAEDQVGNKNEDTPGWDQYYGYGRINAYKALSLFTDISNADIQNQNYSVFPNPSNQNFTISFPPATLQIKIINSLGQPIEIRNVEGLTYYNYRLTENGIYFIQIISDKQTLTKKLIICN